MNLNRLLFRAWTYFRTGYTTYVAFPLGFLSTVIVVYSLGIKPVIDNPSGGVLTNAFQYIFPHLSNFIVVGAAFLTPICIYVGYLHFRRAYAADASVITEKNPYVYKIIPGKEEEVFVPLWMFTAKALARILAREESLSVEEKRQFEDALMKAEKLITGGNVGLPKARSSKKPPP